MDPQTQTVTADCFGIPTAFEMKTEQVGDELKIAISAILPHIEYDAENGVMRVFVPRQRQPE